VKVGDKIEVGDTLCVIEAMKMMNQIEADTAGTVLSIEVENGEPIEFGQTLFVIS
ncbi:MAG: biotin/lipoyl-containing protein, partial [Gammaproteobacteria bacterium]|nr:biotin/lipoyl-containing protein [Gammaproteobacteria bacterium]